MACITDELSESKIKSSWSADFDLATEHENCEMNSVDIIRGSHVYQFGIPHPSNSLRSLHKIGLIERGSQGAIYVAQDPRCGKNSNENTKVDGTDLGMVVVVKRLYIRKNGYGEIGIDPAVLREPALLRYIQQQQERVMRDNTSSSHDCTAHHDGTKSHELDRRISFSSSIDETARVITLYRVVEAPFQELCLVLETCMTDLKELCVFLDPSSRSSEERCVWKRELAPDFVPGWNAVKIGAAEKRNKKNYFSSTIPDLFSGKGKAIQGHQGKTTFDESIHENGNASHCRHLFSDTDGDEEEPFNEERARTPSSSFLSSSSSVPGIFGVPDTTTASSPTTMQDIIPHGDKPSEEKMAGNPPQCPDASDNAPPAFHHPEEIYSTLRSVPVLRYLLRRILRIVAFLHDVCHVCHRDIKPSNFLVSKSGDIRLTDFGSATLFPVKSHATLHSLHGNINNTNNAAAGTIEEEEEEEESLPSSLPTPTTFRTTQVYAAPECILGGRYDDSMDMWGVGVVFVELVLQQPLFDGNADLLVLSEIYALLSSSDGDWNDTPEDSTTEEEGEGEREEGGRGEEKHNKCKTAAPRTYNADEHLLHHTHATEGNLNSTGAFPASLPSTKLTSMLFSKDLPEDGIILAHALLSLQPADRPRAADALHHSFLEFPGWEEDDALGRSLWLKTISYLN